MRNIALTILSSLALAFASFGTSYAQSCSTQYSGTDFSPVSGVTSTYYELKNVNFLDPSSESVGIYSDSKFEAVAPKSLSQAGYTISATDGLCIQHPDIESNNTVNLFNYEVTGLSTTTGKNMYKIEIEFTSFQNPSVSPRNHSWDEKVKVKCSPSGSSEYLDIKWGSTVTYTCTWSAAKSDSKAFSFVSNYSDTRSVLVVKSIKVIGCFDKKITSSNGLKPCAGDYNTLAAKGVTASTYKWEKSIDNGITWTVIEGATEKTYTYEARENAMFRVTAGSEVLTSDPIRPVVCCSVSGERTKIGGTDFQFTGSRTSSANCKYNYKSSGNIDEGEYAVVHSTNDAGSYWTSRELKGHTDGTAKDGFLIVNADKDAFSFYEEYFEGMCDNTVYDFSAYVANACPKSSTSEVLPNVGFRVYGCVSGTTNCSEELLAVESGNLPNGTDWTEKGGSFNSGVYTKFLVKIINNVDAEYAAGGKLVGNDVCIDDIVFSTCKPELQLYSGDDLTSQDTAVCNRGSAATVVLNAAGAYDMTQFFKTPWYIFQESTDKVSWTDMPQGGDITTMNSKQTITVEPTQTEPKYYRVWVAASSDAVKEAKSGTIGTGCGKVYAVTDPISVKYECGCDKSDKPTVKDYVGCNDGAFKLNTLVTSDFREGKIHFYKRGTKVDLGEDYEIDMSNNLSYGETVQYAATFTHNATTDPVMCYSESDSAIITIKKKTLTPYNEINPVKKCYSGVESLTVTLTGLPSPTTQVEWMETEGGRVIATGSSIDLPVPSAYSAVGSYVFVASDPSYCPASSSFDYEVYNKPVFLKVDAPEVVCYEKNSIDISVSTKYAGHLTFTKNGTVVEDGDLYSADALYSNVYTDDPMDASKRATSISYKYVLKNGSLSACQADTTLNVKLQEVKFTVTPGDITTCYTGKENLTYNVTGTTAGSTIEWYNATDPTPIATGATFTIPAPAGKDTAGVYTVKVSDAERCSASKNVTFSVTKAPYATVAAPSMVCYSKNKLTLEITGIRDVASYSISKNGSAWKNGTITTETSVNVDDDDVDPSSSRTTVTYVVSFENGTCSHDTTVVVKMGDKNVIDLPVTGATKVSGKYTVCQGTDVTVKAAYTLSAAETFTWYVDGAVYEADTKNTSINITPTATTVVAIVLNNGPCEGDGSVTINVDIPVDAEIHATKDAICVGTGVDIVDDISTAATSYEWYSKTTGSFSKMSETGADLINIKPQVTTTYYKKTIKGLCERSSNEVTVTVSPAIEFTVSPEDKEICKGTRVEISMSGYPAGADVWWLDPNLDTIAFSATTTVAPLATATYTAEVEVPGGCTASKTLQIQVLSDIKPVISDDAEICQGESVHLSVSGQGVKSYQWIPSTGLDNSKVPQPVATPDKTTRYAAVLSNGACADTAYVQINVNERPRITDIKEKDALNCSDRSIVVTADGGLAPYLYATDTTHYSSDTEFFGLTSGWTTIHVKDDNGCKGDSTFYLEPYIIVPDKFFSPNDDGLNDIWTVQNLDCYDAYRVEIFDRFGCRIYKMTKGGYNPDHSSEDFVGWDGNYNGHPAPSTDYWYLITVEQIRRQYSGHFTLLR